MAFEMRLQEVFKVVSFAPNVMPPGKRDREAVLYVPGRFEHGRLLQSLLKRDVRLLAFQRCNQLLDLEV